MIQIGGVDLEKELKKQKENSKNISDSVLDKVLEIWSNDNTAELEIKNRIKNQSGSASKLVDISLLEPENIYSIGDIKELCVKYKLRFLDTKLFKNEIPIEAIQKIKRLENKGLNFSQFKIIAPEKLFKLGDCNEDPLLFAPIGNDNFYLIHKWGNDLAWYRKLISFPYRKLETLVLTIFLLSLMVTAIIPSHYISAEINTSYFSGSRFLLLIWMGILFCGIASYIFFAFNKSLSNISWNSRHFN